MIDSISIINTILSEIMELGFVAIKNHTILFSIPPLFNIYSIEEEHSVYINRWNITTQYLLDYAKYHNDFDGNYFLCLYDGWRSNSEPIPENKRIYTPWISLTSTDKSYYYGRGSIGEPRFIQNHPTKPEIYPILPYPILAYNRHYNDINVLLIPDSDFLSHEFKSFKREVLSYDISYNEKVNQMFWRGSRHINDGYEYVIDYNLKDILYNNFGIQRIHPRDLVVSFTLNQVFNPNLINILNATYDYASISTFLKYKYLLDIDGKVSAWSALFWKLYSNSIVFKAPTHWEQWYYNKLFPFIHYIPLYNLHPKTILEKFQYCESYHKICNNIATNSTNFIKSLNYEYAVKEYKIH